MACVSLEGISTAAFDAELFWISGRVIPDLKFVPSRFATTRDCVFNCVTVAITFSARRMDTILCMAVDWAGSQALSLGLVGIDSWPCWHWLKQLIFLLVRDTAKEWRWRSSFDFMGPDRMESVFLSLELGFRLFCLHEINATGVDLGT